MADLPVVSRSPLSRLWGAVLRALDLSPRDLTMGADYVAGQPAAPTYAPARALSAMAENPWVYASVSAISTDLAGLPIRVRRGVGPDAVVDDAHPILGLLAEPTRRSSGLLLRRQWWVDLVLSGDAYGLILDGGAPASPLTRLRPNLATLVRVHPARMRAVPDATGLPVAYEYSHAGTVTRYDASRVVHVRHPSWEDGPSELHGLGAIRPLHRDLIADAALAARSASSATLGRPAALARPAKDGDIWAPRVVEQFADSLRKAFRDHDGGIAVLSGAAAVDVLGWSPSELQVPEQRAATRDAIIAALGVPPTRIGLPTANYATAREQSVTYWTNLVGLSALLDDALTRVARLYGDPAVTVYHDASAVDALQASRNERLARAERLVLTFGADPAEALAYEGLADAPSGDFGAPPPAAAQQQSASAAVQRAASVEDRRAAAWRARAASTLDPAETLLRASVGRWLSGARRRTVARARDLGARSAGAPVTREVSPDLLAQLWPVEVERQALIAALGDRLERVLALAFRAAARDLGRIGTPRGALSAEALRDMLISRVVDETTGDLIEATIARHLDGGGTLADIAVELQTSAAFSPARAQTIARTETARAVSTGTLQAYREAEADGVAVRKEWLSSRDGAVRHEHRELDGQVRDLGDPFVVGSHRGDSPGGFNEPEMDVNCRCTLIPVLE